MSIQLIVGLGNPGQAYFRTRHNAGFWFLEALAAQEHLQFKKEQNAQSAVWQLNGKAVRLLMPMTYMNLSGDVVQNCAHFYRLTPQQILVVHDDLDLALGTVKLKWGGGHAGHNGLRDIITKLGGPEFYRMRLGIGHPGKAEWVHDYVLGTPCASDREQMDWVISQALRSLPLIMNGAIDQAMRELALLKQ